MGGLSRKSGGRICDALEAVSAMAGECIMGVGGWPRTASGTIIRIAPGAAGGVHRFAIPRDGPLAGSPLTMASRPSSTPIIARERVRSAPEFAMRQLPRRLKKPRFQVYARWLRREAALDLHQPAARQRLSKQSGFRLSLMIHAYLAQVRAVWVPSTKEARKIAQRCAFDRWVEHESGLGGEDQALVKRRFRYRGIDIAQSLFFELTRWKPTRAEQAWRSLEAQLCRIQMKPAESTARYRRFHSFEQSLGKGKRRLELRALLRRRATTWFDYDPAKERPFPWPEADEEPHCRFWDHGIADILGLLRDMRPNLGQRQKSTAVAYVLAISCPAVWDRPQVANKPRWFHQGCLRVEEKMPFPLPSAMFLRR